MQFIAVKLNQNNQQETNLTQCKLNLIECKLCNTSANDNTINVL